MNNHNEFSNKGDERHFKAGYRVVSPRVKFGFPRGKDAQYSDIGNGRKPREHNRRIQGSIDLCRNKIDDH